MTETLIAPDERTRRTGSALYSSTLFGAPIKAKTRRVFSGSGSGPGSLIVEREPVFRSGTFRDSMGYQNTWEKWHIDQMVSNFTMLRDRSIFSDVPVRNGHPGFLIHGTEGTGKVIGWHTDLASENITAPHDGNAYDFVLASYEILDPDAQRDYENGLLRSRSSEIGYYVTNAEAEFYPVYQGFAFVDIGAVEGLNYHSASGKPMSIHGFAKGTENKQYTIYSEESLVSGTDQNAGASGTTPPAPPALPQPPAVATPPAPVQYAAPVQPHQFSVNGSATSDFAAVQRHIDGLELYKRETGEQARRDFVSALVRDQKVLVTQEEPLVAYASSLNDTQFTAWKGTYDAAPAQSLLGAHGVSGGSAAPAEVTAEHAKNDRISVLRDVVNGLKASGMADAVLHSKPSYRELVELTGNKG